MIFTVPLQPGTVLANVVYVWIAAGAVGAEESAGVTQPSASFAVFRIDVEPPTDAEEIIVYDLTDITNWNAGGYRPGLQALQEADQILLANIWPGGAGPTEIVPTEPPDDSIVRCFGTFKDLTASSAEGIPIEFTLVLPGEEDQLFDLTGRLVQNTETEKILSGRTVKAMLVGGQLQDAAGNPWLDLTRNDYIEPADTKYLMKCDDVGAPAGLTLSQSGGPEFAPVLIELDTATIGAATAGTYDISAIPLPP
jgi:hypothetical protein